MKLQLRKVGDQVACILPDEVAAKLWWTSGDIVKLAIEGEGLKIVRNQTAHDRAMEIADKVMDEYHEVFVTLAKS